MRVLIFFTIIGLFIFCGAAAQTTLQVQGKVSGAWAVDAVNVVGNIEVSGGEKLVIALGCVPHFNGFYSLNIKGSVVAVGSKIGTIYFVVSDTTLFNDFSFEQGG